MAKVSPRWAEDKEGAEPRRCVSPWVPSVTVETLPFTLTGAILLLLIIIMSPVLRLHHHLKNNPSDRAQEHQEYVEAGGRHPHNVTPLTSRPRSAMLFNHWCRTAAAPHDIHVCAGVRRLKRRDSLPAGCVPTGEGGA